MKIVRLVPTVVNSDDAVREFTGRSIKIPYSVELVYLPFLLFKYRINILSFFGREKTDEGLFLVDMLQGMPVNIKRDTKFKISPALQEGFSLLVNVSMAGYDVKKNPLAMEECEIEEEKILPAVLGEDEAVKKGIGLMRYDMMRLAGSFRYRKINILPQPCGRMVYYPYWLIYYRTNHGAVKFAVLDALNKRIEGGEVIKSVKIGLEKSTEQQKR